MLVDVEEKVGVIPIVPVGAQDAVAKPAAEGSAPGM